MPSVNRKRKAQKKRYYQNKLKDNDNGLELTTDDNFEDKRSNQLKKKREASKAAYISNPVAKKSSARAYSRTAYSKNPDKKKSLSRAAYNKDPDRKKSLSRNAYSKNPDKKKSLSRAAYNKDPDRKKSLSRKAYSKDPDRKKSHSKSMYDRNPDRKKALAKALYNQQQGKKKAAARVLSKAKRILNPASKKRANKEYYDRNVAALTALRRGRYVLAEPKHDVKDMYVKKLTAELSGNKDVAKELVEIYKKNYPNVAKRMTRKSLKAAVCRISAKRLLNFALSIREKQVAKFLKTIALVKRRSFKKLDDFGVQQHTANSELYFYDAAYKCLKSMCGTPFVDRGSTVISEWKCTKQCKQLTKQELKAILQLRQAFDESVYTLRNALQTCDDSCPNGHYYNYVLKRDDDEDHDEYELALKQAMGHPLVCYSHDGCNSKLRILRGASVHYPALRTFLGHVYSARKCHKCIHNIDVDLSAGAFSNLVDRTVGTFQKLLSDDMSKHDNRSADSSNQIDQSGLRNPNLEAELTSKYADVVQNFEKEINDQPEHACCSCEMLHRRKSVTKIELSDNIGEAIWESLKEYILERNPDAGDNDLYMCHYCKQRIKNDVMPARCVLNGLQTEPIPSELEKLDSLSTQLIQRAKCYQTVVRLGTYTAKVPTYNSLKACKGTMFFLPLPMQKTLETLQQADPRNLPDPELYVILNGQPTKSRVVWRSLIDVNRVKLAVAKLKEINWLYREVDDDSVDECARRVIEVSNNATSTMLEKATESDIAGFQSYTIRNLDNKLNSESDISQYKLLNVKEAPLDNRQMHLDVMCFPVLFPTGKFGEFYPRAKKISNSEYIKSRLFNKDSRFRKCPQYVFYLLWQKELREINSGVYNVLKSTRTNAMSARTFVNQVRTCDEQLEANLSTMLQSIRGTKQYWYLRKSDLNCMIREYGSPTLFLTFSCAEYESSDITEYLRKVNNVPASYSIGKLCTEDPISVSRQFSLKFHEFFKTVICKGAVLGTVDQYYWKKEYQARGAPHYHVLLWIRDAPVIGVNTPEEVLSWMQERITCHIPDEKTCPELHKLVTRYQSHRCSAYCKKRTKSGNAYITKCKFGFPRPQSENGLIHDVSESLKSRKKIYQLKRDDTEVRINDYNPLLLLNWKANTDVQFVSESSLALAEYVSGYVTKAERSNMQDIWDEVSDNKDIYSRLWSFGLRCLRSRECGLYEASDLLLGDHLCEKSVTVQWVDVSMPHKRKRRVKNHSELQSMAEKSPDSEDIFVENLVDNFYPKRPRNLEGLCLYDFVANYDYCGFDKDGNRVYKKLNKPRLPNHRLFDPQKEPERENYFYSLILLFVPFREESSLLVDGETAEEAFNRLLPTSEGCSAHHSKLQKMLAAQSNLKEINDAREVIVEEERVANIDDEPQLLGEATTAMRDVCEVNTGSNLTLEERESMLNVDQKRIFDKVKNHLLHEKRHESNECSCNIEPLRMFISGVGGTGKSFLIEAIKALVESLWPSKDITCAIAAPTGLAAYNVGGVTVHRLFQLPIEHEGKQAEYWPLPKESLKVMKTTLRNLKMVIVDEVSMVSSLNLVYIHLRLEELFGGCEYFGCKNMLFVGDLLQLPPVNGKTVFERINNKDLLKKLGCTTSVNIWRDSVIYDELTINERQRNDTDFSSMLDCVRRGFPTQETIQILQQRVINVSMAEKFNELMQMDQRPVCLLPRRIACHDFNQEMLKALALPIHEIPCVDEVDETASMRKWNKTAAKQLQKINSDCNLTAGLEAKLTLAVGARVMLRRNIDTKMGLVNGAIGTVLQIKPTRVTVQFDHITNPYDVEKVKSKFMVMKNLYVYRKQFPLILAFGVTIHKCQGLSLDCAIIDLSDKVFDYGMAYVALSRVRTLSGVHLTAFDPVSIKVKNKCLEEVNRLRETYRPDLPLYDIPQSKNKSAKRKLTGTNTLDQPKPKKSTIKIVANPPCNKPILSQSTVSDNIVIIDAPPCKEPIEDVIIDTPPNSLIDIDELLAEQLLIDDHILDETINDHDSSLILPPPEPSNSLRGNDPRRVWPFVFYSVDSEWQVEACQKLGLHYIKPNGIVRGGLDVQLKRPNFRDIIHIRGDGNCLFRSLSYIITGTQDQHVEVRSAILQHMRAYCHLFSRFMTDYNPDIDPAILVERYIVSNRLHIVRSWGTDVEIGVVAHLLNTAVYTYKDHCICTDHSRCNCNEFNCNWQRFSPDIVDRTLSDDVNKPSIYLYHPPSHYDVVKSIIA